MNNTVSTYVTINLDYWELVNSVETQQGFYVHEVPVYYWFEGQKEALGPVIYLWPGFELKDYEPKLVESFDEVLITVRGSLDPQNLAQYSDRDFDHSVECHLADGERKHQSRGEFINEKQVMCSLP